mgnify:CR=1 FL=1
MIEYIEKAIDLTRNYNQFKSRNDLICDIIDVLDVTEDIEVVSFTFAEFENAIMTGKVWNAGTIASWQLAKMKFPQLFSIEESR